MKIQDPEKYFSKKIKVNVFGVSPVIGELYGYDYVFDDEDNEYLEFDVENEDGLIISLAESEIESIEVLG